jgi:sugar/nucleoside kinase (ribokinase family)
MQQLDQLDQLDAKAVMIGHIYVDRSGASSGREGEITKKIIDRYAEKNAFIFANFGRSQFRLGNKFWQRTLPKLTVFQLALDEVREFFSQDHNVTSLRDIIKWFQDNEVTAVITMDKVGAIATLGGGEHGVIFARPYNLEARLVDSTGAGDAFGAGLVSYFVDKITELGQDKNRISKRDCTQIMTIGNFEDAIERARYWAAYCCTKLGAASDCPDQSELDRFKSTLGAQISALVKRGGLSLFSAL